MIYIMIYLPNWYGFKLDGWGYFLEVFITKHAILLSAVNADESQMFSLFHPLIPAKIIQHFGDSWRHFDYSQRLPGLSLEAVQIRLWAILGPAPAFQASPKIQANRKPWGRLAFHLWKADMPFTHQIKSLLQNTAAIGCDSRQAGRLVYMTLWKWDMQDHYPSSFKSWKC